MEADSFITLEGVDFDSLLDRVVVVYRGRNRGFILSDKECLIGDKHVEGPRRGLVITPSYCYDGKAVKKGIAHMTREHVVSSNGRKGLQSLFDEYREEIGARSDEIDVFVFGGNYYKVNRMLGPDGNRKVRFDITTGTNTAMLLEKILGVYAWQPRPADPEGRYTTDQIPGCIKRLSIRPNGSFEYVISKKAHHPPLEWDVLADDFLVPSCR
ncbi:MAG: hypothetical protein ACE5DM_01625 [Candidatus Nanoarchaeia archaeon]